MILIPPTLPPPPASHEWSRIDPEPATVPYVVGLPPYHAPIPTITPTASGTGEAVHPSVWDSVTGWHGFRYWLAITDYGSVHTGENPYIMGSHDGFTWEWPDGITAPLFRYNDQDGDTLNSDTELVHDPETDLLHIWWRGFGGPTSDTVYHSQSADGVTWSPREIALRDNHPTDYTAISPCIWKRNDGTWRMLSASISRAAPSGQKLFLRSSPGPVGPWSARVATAGTGDPWHFGAWHDPDTGKIYGLALENGYTYLYAITSTDGGLTWTRGPQILAKRADSWSDDQLYRPSIQPHPDGQHFRVWYSGAGRVSGYSWRSAYTHVPRSRWP